MSEITSGPLADDRIYVAGHEGLLGSAICRRLARAGCRNVITRERGMLDLTDQAATRRFFAQEAPEYVVLAAGRVGGIADNLAHPADFIAANLSIQLNVMQAARAAGVRRLLFFGSSCMYPRTCRQPMAEDDLLTGRPEPSSLAYALAKLAGVETCLAFNRQDRCQRFMPLIPNSIYGPGDNFDPESGHVLASLVRRFVDAQRQQAPRVVLWGSGQARREFVFVDDVADACFMLLTHDLAQLRFPLNIGSGCDYSIAELAERIARLAGYDGEVAWDTEKPDGAPRKLLDSSRINAWGWRAATDIDAGLRATIAYYSAGGQQARPDMLTREA